MENDCKEEEIKSMNLKIMSNPGEEKQKKEIWGCNKSQNNPTIYCVKEIEAQCNICFQKYKLCYALIEKERIR